MKKIFILALMQVMAPFTALGMNPSFQGQNNEIPVIPYLENTDPRIEPNQYASNRIYATLVPGAMPALNNNPQITNFYLPNNISQPIEPAQFQAYQNQVQFNPMQNLLMAMPINMQNQSKKRAANYPQQNKRRKISPQTNIPNINSQLHNPEQEKPHFIAFQKNTYENIKNNANNKTSHTSKLFKTLKSTELNPASLRLHFEEIYKNTFEDNQLFEIKDETLQKLISFNDIEQTKKNIEKLYWSLDCPIDDCQHTSHTSIENKCKSLIRLNLSKHINTKHTDKPNLEKTIDNINQLTIYLMLNENEKLATILTQNLQTKDNNITSIKEHLEQLCQYIFKNNKLPEIKNELLQKLISDDDIEQTKQNIEKLFWAIDCPASGCQHTTYCPINNKQLYKNLKNHLNKKHANSSKEIITKIKQQPISCVLDSKKHQPVIPIQNLKNSDNNIASIKNYIETRYQYVFKNSKLPEKENALLQKLLSDDGIEQTKQNIEKLWRAIDCPIENCQHTTHTSINNKYPSSLFSELKKHIGTKHADEPNLQKITAEIKQQTIYLVLDKKKYPPIITIQDLILDRKKPKPTTSIDDLKPHDNNITAIKKSLEKFYQSKFKNNKLSEIKAELLQKLISGNDIEQTKQNIKNDLYWAINCPENNCQHTTYLSINYIEANLHCNLKRHINHAHTNNPDLQKIIDEIKQQQINLVLNQKAPNSNNIGILPLETNPLPECVDQESGYDNNPQLGVSDHYSDNLNIIEPESLFDDQNQILAFDDFQDPIFDQFNTNQ